MNEDDFILLSCYAINWVTLLILIFLSERRKRNTTVHVSIQVVYSFFFWYQMKYDSGGGGSLAVWLFWVIFVMTHWFCYLIHIAVMLWRRNGKSQY
ncbi:MAG: hypothetical protein ACFHU9_05970 [Fluviicola sp.]